MIELGGELEPLHVALEHHLAELVATAEASVVEWRWAYGSPLPHRLEPLLHERVWIMRGGFAEERTLERFGFDAGGEVVVARTDMTGRRAAPYSGTGEIVLRQPGVVVVVIFGEEVPRGRLLFNSFVRYSLEDGRPVRTEYVGSTMDPADRGEERYRYDGDRLVAIEEYEALTWTVRDWGYREQVMELGGELVLDGDVLRREDEIVWQPSGEPWPARLERAAGEYAAQCVEFLRGFALEPVDTLWLNHYSQHGVQASVLVGEAGRLKRWEFWDDAGFFHEPDDFALLRDAALAAEDAVLEVVEAVARRLARQDWTGILPVTDAFVVFVAEYSQEPEVKKASLRRVNPPDVVERWLRLDYA